MDQESLKAEFLEAYEQYADELYRFCFFKVSDTERAEDIVQDTFTRFWQTLRKGDTIENPRALLFMIARNRVIDWYRKKKESSLDVLQEAGMDVLGNTAKDVEQSAEIAEVLAAVHTLDEPSREVILLRFVEGWTPQEIAASRGESANAVSVRLNRAIKKVQDHMHL
ncbi:MAG: polymerase sigma factor, sigma-70 family [Parcubacteria group bacterium]|nr:polymerase sigma factor, sigma-70 family [Parcubacteria group bacterium]